MAIKARNSVTVADVSDGIDGTGISSTTVEYQAGSSGTSKPTGTWSTTIPATSASAPYLWTRVTYRYSDGRSPLEVFSVGATPKSIEIGGRNVIRNSAFINGFEYWSRNGNTSSVDTDRTFNGHPTIKVCNTGLTGNRWYGLITHYLPQKPTSILAGETWTVSCYYYVEDASTIDGEFALEVKGIKEGAISDSTIGRTTSLKGSNTVEGAWTKIEKTFTATEDYSNCYVYAWTSRNGTVWFADFKLEKGNKATDWTPAPEDTQSQIDNTIDTAVTNLQIGGRNLLSKAMMGTTTAISVNSLSGYGYTNGLDNTELAGTTKVLGLRPSVNYVISFTAWCGANTQNMYVDLYPDTLPEKVFTLTTTPTRFVFNVYSTSADMPNGYLRFFKANGFMEDVYITDIMVEQGNKASQSWTPAPEDIDASISDVDAKFANYSTTTQMTAAITAAKDSITQTVSETYSTKAELETVDGKVTTLEEWQSEASQKITKDGIIATVGNYYAYQSDLDTVENRVTEAETQILQQADEISLRVKKDGIINAINLSTEEVKISAARITLAGATIADSFTATNLHITGNSTFDGILNGATGSFSGNIMAATLVVDNKISMNTAYGTTGKLFSTGESMDLPNVLWVDFDQIFSDVKFMSSYVDFYGEVYVERGISVGDTISAEGIIRSEVAVSAGGMASIDVDSEGGSLNIASASGNVWHIDSPLGGLRFCSQTDGANRMELGRWGGLALYDSGLEFYCSTPYIDFHFGYSSSDYTSRIIEYKAGFLRVEAALYTLDYSGTYRRPVTSANGETNQVVMLSTSASTKLSITGSWSDASTYTAKTITVSSSDIRLKESVEPSTVDALSLINKIKIRQFRWKDSGEHQNIGFIADELENLDEKLAVGGGYTEDGFMNVKSVDDFYLLGYLTKGVQELDQKYDLKVSELESKNEQLTVRIECRQDEQQILIEQLMDENAELKKRVAQLEEQNSTT